MEEYCDKLLAYEETILNAVLQVHKMRKWICGAGTNTEDSEGFYSPGPIQVDGLQTQLVRLVGLL
jgi:hypothetical protein